MPDPTGGPHGEDFSREHAEAMLGRYAQQLDEMGYEPVPYPHVEELLQGTIYRGAKFDALCHARWMCDQTKAFMAQGRWPKAYRWIGMIQGLVFMGGMYSIVELKRHNRG